jgi:hypothetical protein
VDVEPVKLSPTWRNFRTGDEEVAKILDRFLVSEALLNLGSNFRSGVEVGGISDHRLSPYIGLWALSHLLPPLNFPVLAGRGRFQESGSLLLGQAFPSESFPSHGAICNKS